MLRIDQTNKKFIRLEQRTMREAGYWERRDIQNMICLSPGAFCEELGEYIYFVGAEIQPSEFVQDRIDLLGVDPDGVAVVIELKRASHKLQLLQALSYAAMLSEWEPKKFSEALVKFNADYTERSGQTGGEAEEELAEILEGGDVDVINRRQRVVLLAEDFDYEVLATAEWLTDRYSLDIRCYRIGLAKHGDDDFLSCTRAYPPPDLADIAIRRTRKKDAGLQTAANWDDVLGMVDSEVVVRFFRSEIDSDVFNRPERRLLIYRHNGRIIFRIWAWKPFATVLQRGRFEGDEQYWKSRLSPDAGVRARNTGRDLRFRLQTESDFSAFKSAWDGDLRNKKFTNTTEDEAEGADERSN